jgi:hypothetical protein
VSTVKLDPSKLLGFRLGGAVALGAKTGVKVGVKPITAA